MSPGLPVPDLDPVLCGGRGCPHPPWPGHSPPPQCRGGDNGC